ncbi:cation diffusion facilitator family transporter [Catenulispora acidiphila DSM 44928]|uniref:Cation diffusion facilitator family transporter n=1 Tax=Catenulispora acidiphila (strain DSM 44928 / JCM 14897 / NBRC 102108 / NRRL B-24433 / ID139908) TaxID=479433 RepID=C7QEZ9_CATAD|nr:cation diffusion facilitator family transporter [Catenulispora acidiphila]ACU74757.1 cation diffusion facilitator family transporter [Catenulispora acidiphila DSM 44928]
MSAEGSSKAVVAALAANMGIAVSKFVAYAFTGSASMLAEGVHSVADSGNQVLLLIGGKQARKKADAEHPFGYGRERFVYAFVVSVVLFSVGGLFALYEGWHKITHPEKVDSWYWAVGVLLFAMVMEGMSFRTAVRESNRLREGSSWLGFIRRATNPELPVVLLEDSGALLGLCFALFGVGMAVITDNGRWDGVGTLAIGALLVCIAIILAVEMKSLLVGEGAGKHDVAAIRAAAVDGHTVTDVIHLRTMYLGPEELLVAIKIAVEHDDTAAQVAEAIDAAEARIRAAVPEARLIYLEPDVRRPGPLPEPVTG